ncbi:MAG: hypothetical protein J7L61_02575 [Thermoplasmata archaeon]|nr:hypothetical protein [Thermoplasmata archaeon]
MDFEKAETPEEAFWRKLPSHHILHRRLANWSVKSIGNMTHYNAKSLSKLDSHGQRGGTFFNLSFSFPG